MERIRKILEARRQNLSHIKNQKEKALSNVPHGNLRICNNKGRIQYYHRTNPKDFNGVYLREQDKEVARQLAQKDYDQKVFTEVEKELIATERYLKATKSLDLKQIYETLHQERQKLVTPIWLPDNEFIKAWEETEYKGKEFIEGSPEFYTEKNERVRSKSEVLIADLLNREKIPYKYEAPLYLRGVGITYPDFTILNVENRQEIYWEHLGMMDDPNYVDMAIKKINTYEQNEILLGKNLLLTYETKKNPLNSKTIKLIIQHYLKQKKNIDEFVNNVYNTCM